MTLQKLFHHKSRWTQRSRARDLNGNACDSVSGRAVAFCLLGGLDKCYKDYEEWQQAFLKLQKALGTGTTLVTWNDAEERTFEEVCTLVKKADV